MKIQRFPHPVVRKFFLVLLLAMLAFQGLGMEGLAAPAISSLGAQTVTQSQTLTCGCPTTSIQTVLLIDDSGSMRANDPTSARNEKAKELVNTLAESLDSTNTNLQNVQVAIVHFTDDVKKDDPQINITPKFIDLKASTVGELFKIIDWKPNYHKKQYTNFVPPFKEAASLFRGKKAASELCTRQSIVLLSDGTPEDLQGRLTGEQLKKEIKDEVVATGIVDKLIVIGYQVNPKYFNAEIKEYWNDAVKAMSRSQNDVPGILFFPKAEQAEVIAEALKPVNTYLQGQVEIPADLQKYQTMTLNSEYQPLQSDVQNDIRFTLLDSDGNPVLPGNVSSPYKLELTTSITQAEQKQDSQLSGPDGDSYHISWTPVSPKDSKLELVINFLDKNNQVALGCSATVPLPFNPTPPPPTSTTALSLVIMPPREPIDKNKALILPMRLNSDKPLSSVDWVNPDPPNGPSPSAKLLSNNRPINAQVIPVNAANGEYNLQIDPVGNGDVSKGIEASVSAKVFIKGQDNPITIPRATTDVSPLMCVYDKAWNMWFWPLVIVLAGLLILLLVIRIMDPHTQKDYQEARSDTVRVRKWRFLLVPVLFLLSFLILNRVWWCYVIPWWLFLASILGLIVAVFPLAYFAREDRRRLWALAFLLIAVALIVVASITINIPPLPLLATLLLTLIARWYIRPDEHPDPHPVPPASISLIIKPSGQPQNGAVSVPMQLGYEGQGAWTSLQWLHSAKNVSSGKALNTAVNPNSIGSGEYNLTIDPIGDASKIQVQVSAAAGIGGQIVTTPQATFTIEIARPTPDPLEDIEGIGKDVAELLNKNRIFTFKQLAKANVRQINDLLNTNDMKMLDPKTWPQQAKLADIAREYGRDEDKQNYEAYKAWLKGGIEPDEYGKDEKDRRTEALVWNQISKSTPIVLSLACGPSSLYVSEAITLPIQLNSEEDEAWLSSVEWKVSAKTMPSSKAVRTTVNSVDKVGGKYELVVHPIQDQDAKEIQVIAQAMVNGRSIEFYYGKAIMVQVCPPPAPDDLADLEGIGRVTAKLLNDNGIFTFKQLAKTTKEDITSWLNSGDLKMLDPKTWPQQAKLADIAKKYGRKEDQQNYEAYKAWLKDGIEPDEYDKDEKDRRSVALVWPIAPESIPDRLEELEGIGKEIAEVINDQGIFTFKQLAQADIKQIATWLNECGYQQMDPKTWPQQAKLAGIAKDFRTEVDRRNYEAYKAWLKAGIEPDEYGKDEKDRRQVALVWHGTAELTERAYPEIFTNK